MVALRVAELDADNVAAAIGIRVKPEQETYVASVASSIAEAYVTPTAWPRVILADDEVVGFVMGNFDVDDEIAAFRAGIWRLNVSANAQGRGIGRFAVAAVAEEARRRGFDRITVLWKEGPDGPALFYGRLGFVPTGERFFGQVVGALDL